jgi:hypothetical protein
MEDIFGRLAGRCKKPPAKELAFNENAAPCGAAFQ